MALDDYFTGQNSTTQLLSLAQLENAPGARPRPALQKRVSEVLLAWPVSLSKSNTSEALLFVDEGVHCAPIYRRPDFALDYF